MDAAVERRLQRLEETCAFAEHAADRLQEALADLAERFSRLAARVEALERSERRREDAGVDEPAARSGAGSSGEQ